MIAVGECLETGVVSDINVALIEGAIVFWHLCCSVDIHASAFMQNKVKESNVLLY